MRSFILLLGLVFSPLHAAKAAVIQFQSTPATAALLELFTSEGCSSCPPAEAWLARLKDDARLWKEFVPVAFHVDYWDGLGWKDPFAKAAFTDRQRRYAAEWRGSSVYTPGFVWNGAEWREWFQRESLPRVSSADAGVLAASSADGTTWAIRFTPNGAARRAFTAHVALLGFDLDVQVKAGENRGRELKHDFVALALAETRLTQDGGVWRGELKLNPKPGLIPKRTALAAWVTAEALMQPVQSVGGWLPTAKAP